MNETVFKVLLWVFAFAALFLYCWRFDPTVVKERKQKKRQELAESFVDKLNDKG
jgi:hypothetical protein